MLAALPAISQAAPKGYPVFGFGSKACTATPGANCAGVSARQAAAPVADLSGINFRGADLRGTDFTGATLRDARMAGITTGPLLRWPERTTRASSGRRESSTCLPGASAQCTDTNFTGAQRSGAQLQNAILAGADFTCTDITGANMTAVYLAGVDFASTNLSDVTFTGAILQQAISICD